MDIIDHLSPLVYFVFMVKTSSTHLKAKLGKYMREVRAGKEVIVTDRGHPVARIVPFRQAEKPHAEVLRSRPRDPTAPPLGEVVVKSIRYRGNSTTALLREDRDRR